MSYKEERVEHPILSIEDNDSTHYFKVDNIDKIAKDDDEIIVYCNGDEYYFYTEKAKQQYEKLQKILELLKSGKEIYSSIIIKSSEEDEN